MSSILHRTRQKTYLPNLILTFIRGKHSMRLLYRPSTAVLEQQHVADKMSNSSSKSQRLMTELGLIQQGSLGCYCFLPVGLKSLEKLSNIIDHFMNTVNAQKMQLPTLTPASLWEETGRLRECDDELMKTTDRQRRQYILSPTHEESVCKLISGAQLSHKQLPLRLYQITTKFRDEMRPRFGLLRCREFIMKDLYTFDKDEQSSQATYDLVNAAYASFFDYIGVKWLKVRGSSGAIGGKVTHEYHFVSSAGEDEVVICQSCSNHFNKELANKGSSAENSKVGESIQSATLACIACGSHQLTVLRAIEVGHSFLLGTKYTSPLHTAYVNSQGKPQKLEMGCHGLGVSRILASVIEVLSTSSEIRWPLALAPYLFAIILPKHGSKEEKNAGDLPERFINYLDGLAPKDVLVDDRSELTIGRRFVDLKMLGIPYIIVLGKRIMEKPSVVEFHDVYNESVTALTQEEAFDYTNNVKSKMGVL